MFGSRKQHHQCSITENQTWDLFKLQANALTTWYAVHARTHTHTTHTHTRTKPFDCIWVVMPSQCLVMGHLCATHCESMLVKPPGTGLVTHRKLYHVSRVWVWVWAHVCTHTHAHTHTHTHTTACYYSTIYPLCCQCWYNQLQKNLSLTRQIFQKQLLYENVTKAAVMISCCNW